MNDLFSLLVSKMLAGEASIDEKNALKDLMNRSDRNVLLYNELKEYWDADVKMNRTPDENTFSRKIQSKLTQEKTFVRRNIYLRVAGIAAALFFVTTCTLGYLLHTRSQQKSYTYAAQNTPANYELPDGSIVKLNKHSSITFDSDFGAKTRDIQLLGEAFFDVAKNKTVPFFVNTSGTKTRVLGTKFNVKEENDCVVATLIEGSVNFTSEGCNVLLSPGEEVVYNTKQKSSHTRKTDVQLNTAWVTGRFNYCDITFAELLSKLEQIFDVRIELLGNNKIAERIVSASFLTNEPISAILQALEDELNFKYTVNNDSTLIIIKSKTSKTILPMP